MKNIVFAGFVVLIFLFTCCTKESDTDDAIITVAKKNTALFTKQTATWCGLSGTWGWKLNAELVPFRPAGFSVRRDLQLSEAISFRLRDNPASPYYQDF